MKGAPLWVEDPREEAGPYRTNKASVVTKEKNGEGKIEPLAACSSGRKAGSYITGKLFPMTQHAAS